MSETRAISPEEVVRSGLCIGCGSCVAQSGSAEALITLDGFGQLRPAGPPEWRRRRSETLSRTCPFSPAARNEDELAAELFPDVEPHPSTGRARANYVGYVAEPGFRDRGSSGGMVSWVLAELLRTGRVDSVAHVAAVEDPQAEGRFFKYRLSRTDEEISAGAKSRYYPVELSEVLAQIRAVPGRYAVVGVPCFIKAIQLLRREDPVIRERVAYTLGLFCGHMKSARFVESFAWQLGVPLAEVQRVEYRLKDPSRPASTYTAQLLRRDGSEARRDWWNLADGDWGAGFFMYSACNYCDDVVAETADISFGDAWVEPYSSDGRGTNVVVLRSREVAELVDAAIADGRLALEPVDNDFIHRTQAAGFRQRREGLAYRLLWPKRGLRPRKRVTPTFRIAARRRLIYHMRALISAGSHRLAWLAARTGHPEIYVRWARLALTVYHGLAYSRGRLGQWIDRLTAHRGEA
ncbi:MAG: Coenzyme F420 hydrogenase/dehydrogenase, beta subunit C-terminal domain [Armatimonadota bacterium]